MSTAIKGLLFDKDGTLFDFHATWGVWCSGFIRDISDGDTTLARDLSEVLEYDLDRSAFRESARFIAGTIDDILDPMLAILPTWRRDDLMQHIFQSGSAAKQVPVVALVPLLQRLKGNALTIGVATNDHEMPARAHLRSVEILEFFDFVSGSDSGYGAKPEPGMLLGFCEATGLAPQQVAMVGDSTHDLRAGRAAGMVNIGVLTGPARAEELEPFADVVFPDIGAIPGWMGLK